MSHDDDVHYCTITSHSSVLRAFIANFLAAAKDERKFTSANLCAARIHSAYFKARSAIFHKEHAQDTTTTLKARNPSAHY